MSLCQLQAELDAVKAAQRTALSAVMAALEDGLVASGAVQRTKRSADDASRVPATKKPRMFDLESFELDSDLSDSESDWSEADDDSLDEAAAGASADSDQDAAPADLKVCTSQCNLMHVSLSMSAFHSSFGGRIQHHKKFKDMHPLLSS